MSALDRMILDRVAQGECLTHRVDEWLRSHNLSWWQRLWIGKGVVWTYCRLRKLEAMGFVDASPRTPRMWSIAIDGRVALWKAKGT
jgi:hypothetical protein